MSLYKEYVATVEDNKKIKFSITFNRSTHNWATSEKIPIGYRVSATPVEIGDRFESFGAFTGFNDTLLEVNRQSSKRLDEAIRILQERKETYIKWFKDNKGIKFKENSNE